MTEAFECHRSVKEKLDRLLDKKNAPGMTILKAGPYRRFPVKIYSLTEDRKNGRYLYRTDELAHVLTLAATPVSSVRSFIITGESAQRNGQLLTHIYYPARQALALYLYPRRLDLIKRRYDQDRHAFLSQPGYLHSVLQRLELHRDADLAMFLLAAEACADTDRRAIAEEHSEHYQDVLLATSLD
ncbi:MAG: hypothetical protein HS115_18065 [Spirochaetales bacterium]|nr:hypothetical protein [Spirochaetales bacterium]